MTSKVIIDNLQIFGDNLNVYVQESFVSLQKELILNQKITQNPQTHSKRKGKALCYAALGVTALGIIGLMSSDDAEWPKISVGTGVLLLVFDIMNRRKSLHANKDTIVGDQKPSISKQTIQEKINDIINNVEDQWDKHIDENQREMITLIDESTASRDNKFLANNIAYLPRKIQFNLLPYIVNILNANSDIELDKVITEIRNDFLSSISDTVKKQILDYESIAQKIGL